MKSWSESHRVRKLDSSSATYFTRHTPYIMNRQHLCRKLYIARSTTALSVARIAARSITTASSSTASNNPSTFSTINASEISHFSKLSSQWWSETGEFALLHRMNPVRVEWIRQKVALAPPPDEEWSFKTRHMDAQREAARGTGAWLTGLRCLDVGCGGGILSEALARLGATVVSVDASESNIGIATTHASQDPYLAKKMEKGELEYQFSTAEALRDAGEKFDVVCSMEVLEHVDEPREFMKCLGEMVNVSPGVHFSRNMLKKKTAWRTSLTFYNLKNSPFSTAHYHSCRRYPPPCDSGNTYLP